MMRTRIVFFLLSITVVISAAGFLMANRQQDDELFRALGNLSEVIHLVHSEYVDEVDLGALTDSLEAGIMQSIDPSAAVLPESVMPTYRELLASNPPFGLVLGLRLGTAAVQSTLEGSPADAAEIKRWEIVELIDGVATRGRPLWQIRLQLFEKERSAEEVRLTVIGRVVEDRREVVLTPSAWQPVGAKAKSVDEVLVIRVNHLAKGSAEQIRSLLIPGQPTILDLRNVVWGSETEAVKTADLFASEGVLAQWTGRRAGDKTFSASEEKTETTMLVALVNHNTQGVGEILAAALRRADATLVGDPTMGLAYHMQMIHDQDLHLWFPVGNWLRADGQPISRNGIEPDEVVDRAGSEEETDPVLDRALALIQEALAASAAAA